MTHTNRDSPLGPLPLNSEALHPVMLLPGMVIFVSEVKLLNDAGRVTAAKMVPGPKIKALAHGGSGMHALSEADLPPAVHKSPGPSESMMINTGSNTHTTRLGPSTLLAK